MSAGPQWRYAQARLQARHGERLQESDWHALEAAQSLHHFIERARGTALRRFTEPVSATLESHAIERVLRAAWRNYVVEIAHWVPENWRPAVLWTAHLADLPILDALLHGEAPAWTMHDAAVMALIEADPAQPAAALEQSGAAPLASGAKRAATLSERWYRHWRTLWPSMNARDARAMTALTGAVSAHRKRLAHAGAEETTARHARDLDKALVRLFRRHSASPTAVFSHLALVALDLERLRGDLMRRKLFTGAKEAA